MANAFSETDIKMSLKGFIAKSDSAEGLSTETTDTDGTDKFSFQISNSNAPVKLQFQLCLHTKGIHFV